MNGLPGSWPSWLTSLVATPIAFTLLLIVLRVAGKKTLAKMTAYGLTITVAFGSVFATVLLNRSVSLLDGAVVFATLAALQGLFAWASSRSALFARVVTAQPTLLVCRGEVDHDRLRRQRVRVEEVWAAIRAAGCSSVTEALAVVLETDGSLSVIRSNGGDAEGCDALTDVDGWERLPRAGGTRT